MKLLLFALLGASLSYGCRGQEPDAPATPASSSPATAKQANDPAQRAPASGTTCMQKVEAWCACQERIIVDSGLDERSAAAIIRGVEMNRTAAQRSDEHCQKVLAKLPPTGPCAPSDMDGQATGTPAGGAQDADATCRSDDDCVLSRIIPDGDLRCCKGCVERAVTNHAHAAVEASCEKTGLPASGCPKKKCVPRKHVARCEAGTCRKVESP